MGFAATQAALLQQSASLQGRAGSTVPSRLGSMGSHCGIGRLLKISENTQAWGLPSEEGRFLDGCLPTCLTEDSKCLALAQSGQDESLCCHSNRSAPGA